MSGKRNPYLDEPEEYASLNVDADYEGVQEIDGEFYYSESPLCRCCGASLLVTLPASDLLAFR